VEPNRDIDLSMLRVVPFVMIVADLRSHTIFPIPSRSDFLLFYSNFGPPLDPSAERLPSINILALLDFLPLPGFFVIAIVD